MMYTSRHQLIKSELIMALTRPPKPPCWRDFVSVKEIKKKKHDRSRLEPLEFTDLGQVLQNGPDYLEPFHATKQVAGSKPKTENKSKSPVPKEKPKHDKEGHKSRKEKEKAACDAKTTPRRSKHRLHRTRSSAALRPENLGEMTVTLAEADSRQLGLHPRKSYSDYQDENHRRCMKWLQSVQESQPLDDVAFLGGSGEELEIPEENALDLQTVQVCDQSHRETTGDFLDSDAIKLSPMDREAQYERKHTKTKSKAHRKAKRKHAEKSKTTARDKSNQDYDVYNEITNYILGAKTLNLAKATQTVLDDIAEISSSKESDSNNKTPKAKLVPADQDGEKKTADAKSEDVVEIDLHEANKEALVTERFYDTNKESVHERTLNFQDETDQWQTLCESLQTYTFDAEYDDDDHPTDSAQCKS